MVKNVSSGRLPVQTSMFTSNSGNLVNCHNRSLVDGAVTMAATGGSEGDSRGESDPHTWCKIYIEIAGI